MKRQHHRHEQLKKSNLPWRLRCNFKNEDIDYVTYLHGVLYASEYGYDQAFEAYVAAGLAEFLKSFNPKKDRMWLAEADDQIIGVIAVARHSELVAQLRWFLVHPDYRGQCLGSTLMKKALEFCNECKYEIVFLWTTNDLHAARRLYLHTGFKKVEEKTHTIWGKRITRNAMSYSYDFLENELCFD